MPDLDALPCAVLQFSPDGRLRASNAQLQRLLGLQAAPSAGTPFGALMTTGSRVLFETHLLPALRLAGSLEEAYLKLQGADGDVPVLLNARSTADAAVGVLIRVERRERWESEILESRRHAQRSAEELAAATEELRVAKKQLEEQIAEIENSHWLLRRVSEVLPMCVDCGKVREGREWTSLAAWLKKNARFLSHGYCPECAERVLAELDGPS